MTWQSFLNTHFHFHGFERSYKYCNTLSQQFDRNYSFEDMNLFNFEEDTLNVDGVYQVDIYNSRFAKHFVRHQAIISISTTRFGLRAGLFMLLRWTLWQRRWKKFPKPRHCLNCTKAGVQNCHICSFQWAQSCLMQQKTVRGSAQW